MDTNFLIKLFILFGILYLMLECTCVNEHFSYDINKPVTIKLKNKDDEMVFIDFSQLNDNIKNNIIDKFIKTEYLIKENEIEIKKGIFYKNPIFLIYKKDLSKYTNLSDTNIKFNLVNDENNFILIPIINGNIKENQYLYSDNNLGIMYFSEHGKNKHLVKITDYKLNLEYITNPNIIIDEILNKTLSKEGSDKLIIEIIQN